jgi:hypothetical protein
MVSQRLGDLEVLRLNTCFPVHLAPENTGNGVTCVGNATPRVRTG